MKRVTADLLPIPELGPSQAKDYLAWVYRDGFDATVLHHPRTVMARALADGEPIAYTTVTPILRFGSLAARPGTSVLQIAQGLREICRIVDQVALETGFAEAEMMTCVEAEKEMCVRRGWTVVLQDGGTYLLRHRTTTPLRRGPTGR